VHFSRIEMQVEAPGRSENAPNLGQSRFEEVEVVVVDVQVALRAQLDRPIAPPAKPGSVARLVVSNRP